jgi:hypothetical protein
MSSREKTTDVILVHRLDDREITTQLTWDVPGIWA